MLAHAQYPCPKSNTIGGLPKPNQSFEIISILVTAYCVLRAPISTLVYSLESSDLQSIEGSITLIR